MRKHSEKDDGKKKWRTQKRTEKRSRSKEERGERETKKGKHLILFIYCFVGRGRQTDLNALFKVKVVACLCLVNGVELVLSQFCVDGGADVHWRQRDGLDIAGYVQERYDEIFNEMKSILTKVGWETEFIARRTGGR